MDSIPMNPSEEIHRQLRDRAMRNPDYAEVTQILEEIAQASLSPRQEDDILGVLKNGGHAKQTLSAELRQKKQMFRQSQSQFDLAWRYMTGEGSSAHPTACIENVEVLLNHLGVVSRYDLMRHRAEHIIPGVSFPKDEARNNTFTWIENEVYKAGMRPHQRLRGILETIAGKNQWHPFDARLQSRQWDGQSRLRSVLDCLHVDPYYCELRDVVVFRWLASVVAAVYGYNGRQPRGVLVLQGPQGCGKTQFFMKLMFPETHKAEFVLRPDKDSQLEALKYHTVEFAELDATKRASHISALKAFITRAQDDIRKSYAAEHSEMERRTVFCATVNPDVFLKDPTGNTRFWTVPITRVDLNRMDALMANGGREQLWLEMKQVYGLWTPGLIGPWELSPEEAALVEDVNEDHREVTIAEQAVDDLFDWTKPRNNPMTMSDIARVVFQGRGGTEIQNSELRRVVRQRTGQKKGEDTTVTVGNERKTGKWYWMPPLPGTGQILPFQGSPR